MNLMWGLIGGFLLGWGFYLAPWAAIFAAAGAAIVVLAYINQTVGPILALATAAARAFTHGHADRLERIQAMSRAVILWRQI